MRVSRSSDDYRMVKGQVRAASLGGFFFFQKSRAAGVSCKRNIIIARETRSRQNAFPARSPRRSHRRRRKI